MQLNIPRYMKYVLLWELDIAKGAFGIAKGAFGKVRNAVASIFTSEFLTRFDYNNKHTGVKVTDTLLQPVRSLVGRVVTVTEVASNNEEANVGKVHAPIYMKAMHAILFIGSLILGGIVWTLCVGSNTDLKNKHGDYLTHLAIKEKVLGQQNWTDGDLKEVAHYCEKLKKLNLKNCPLVTPKGVSYFKPTTTLTVQLKNNHPTAQAIRQLTIDNMKFTCK